jgi:CubicO group peptidase (beta-lactamase class C family)
MEKQKLVGLSVGVLRDGRVVYLQGYGLADRENKVRVTPKTVFNWASNSKPLAAVLAMQLVETKLLDLDADVRKYVPEFPRKDSVVTVRHLLCHQSGIPHYANGKVVPTERTSATRLPFLDPVLALDRFNRSPLLFTPGDKVSYSSYAYILLSAVVQRAGKEPFADQVNARIARPLKMASLQLDLETAGQPNWAAGYVRGKDGAFAVAKEDAHYWKHGAGGYKSDVGDFARWAEGLINHKLVSPAAEKAMWTRQPLKGGEATTWGLGFTVDESGGFRVSHNGGQGEVSTRMVLYPRDRHGVVAMSNCSGSVNIGAVTTAVYTALRGK